MNLKILAAVLVPNVLRYINQARQANCQQEAASVLTDLQAQVADVYANSDDVMTDIQAIVSAAGRTGAYDASPAVPDTNEFSFSVVTTTTDEAYGTINDFFYSDGSYSVEWNGDWQDITAVTAP